MLAEETIVERELILARLEKKWLKTLILMIKLKLIRKRMYEVRDDNKRNKRNKRKS